MLSVLIGLLSSYNGDAGIQEIHFLSFVRSGAVVKSPPAIRAG